MLNSRLRSEVVDSEECQGLTSDVVKADLRNINPTKAAGLDKIHPSFLHHLGLITISLLTSSFNKSWVETKVPQEWRVANIRPIPKGGKDLQKIESHRPIYLTLTAGKQNIQYFAESMQMLTEYQVGPRYGHYTAPTAPIVSIHK